MKVLFIAHRLPFPPNKGDKIRAHNMLRHLARHHEVHVVALIDDKKDLSCIPDARTIAESVSVARIDGMSRLWKALLSFITRRSISEEVFYSRTLQRRVDELQKEHEFELIFCSSSPTAEYVYRSSEGLGSAGSRVRIMDLIDVDSVKWRQYADDASWPMSLIYAREARKLASYETRIGEDFDRVLVVSPNEAKLFPASKGVEKVTAIGNGVDLEYFSPGTPETEEQGQTLVFVGMMDYRPNIDGVGWFIDSVFPAVRAEFPECELIIVGGKPTPRVLGWQTIDGVQVTGFVDDVRTYMRRASLSIVPLRIARGIQNKVLEAMAMEKAIVATPQAVEGIRAKPGNSVIVAGTADEFSHAIVDLLRNPARAGLLAIAARECVETNYSWTSQLQELDELIDELAEPWCEQTVVNAT